MIASVPDLCMPFTFFYPLNCWTLILIVFVSFGKNVVLAILFPFCIIK